jgi:hypothetical protein
MKTHHRHLERIGKKIPRIKQDIKAGHTERVYHTIWFLCETGYTTNPFSTISKFTQTVDFVRAVESSREEVPYMDSSVNMQDSAMEFQMD